VIYFLTDCDCKWISHPFMLLKALLWKAILKFDLKSSEMSENMRFNFFKCVIIFF
jgi:hypothetical protein